MKKLILLIFFWIIYFLNAESQMSYSEFNCLLPSELPQMATGTPFGGAYKPNRTDLSGGGSAPLNSHFPVLIIFIQFKDEPTDPRSTWPKNEPPVYLNNLIARDKDTVGNWWNWYDSETEIFSSHWAEISRGKFHVISPAPFGVNTAFSVVLSKTAQQYFTLYNYDKYLADSAIHKEVWDSIKAQGLIDWRVYDRWSYNSTTGYFYFSNLGQGDDYVDMIYQVFKSRGGGVVLNANNEPTTIFNDNDGYAGIGSWYFLNTEVDDFGTKINPGYGFEGSGFTVSFRGQLSQYIGTIGHEHGHYLFYPGHSTYSRVSYGFGFDNFYSPSDMILNGYMSPTDATINAENILGDYSSRNSGTGNLLKVTVQGNEYFLLASRNKISKWDRVMIGDSSQLSSYDDTTKYGKGLYIYHIKDGLNFNGGNISQQDMECADGLYEFEYVGQAAQQVVHDCFISSSTAWPYYRKKKVIYENDFSNLHYPNIPTGYTPRAIRDGISLRYYVGLNGQGNPIFHYKWFGEGTQPSSSCNIGTDRQFTNDNQIYSRYDIGGDRNDPWNPGYCEIFSPYSSPNSNTWTTNPPNVSSGIYIWYRSFNPSTKEASIRIYKVGQNGQTDSSILAITPPSKPMGIVVDYYLESENITRPRITWNHNKEPDMLSSNLKKRYKLWRATYTNMNYVPVDYVLHRTLDIDSGIAPSFIDSVILGVGSGWPGMGPYHQYPLRYVVQAIDKYGDSSVRSDFGTAIGLSPGVGGSDPIGPDNLNLIDKPKSYELYQNFPNPFNPVTTIKFDLSDDGEVKLEVFDISGRLASTLINEFRAAGWYEIDFNGQNFASGIYYYRIKSGSFVQVKKMILLK